MKGKKIEKLKILFQKYSGLNNPDLCMNFFDNLSEHVGLYLTDHPHINIGKLDSNALEDFKNILDLDIRQKNL